MLQDCITVLCVDIQTLHLHTSNKKSFTRVLIHKSLVTLEMVREIHGTATADIAHRWKWNVGILSQFKHLGNMKDNVKKDWIYINIALKYSPVIQLFTSNCWSKSSHTIITWYLIWRSPMPPISVKYTYLSRYLFPLHISLQFNKMGGSKLWISWDWHQISWGSHPNWPSDYQVRWHNTQDIHHCVNILFVVHW